MYNTLSYQQQKGDYHYEITAHLEELELLNNNFDLDFFIYLLNECIEKSHH